MYNGSVISFHSSIFRCPEPCTIKTIQLYLVLIPTSTYLCLIISFEHIADTLLTGCIVLNQTSKVTWIVTIVNQFVNLLRLTLEDAGADQWIPLLTFP